jgi:hypothetical protein
MQPRMLSRKKSLDKPELPRLLEQLTKELAEVTKVTMKKRASSRTQVRIE